MKMTKLELVEEISELLDDSLSEISLIALSISLTYSQLLRIKDELQAAVDRGGLKGGIQ